MADENTVSKKVGFFHGSEANIPAKIEDGTISSSNIIISTEDNIIYVDDDKQTHTLGSAKSKQAYTVQLGAGGSVGGIKTGDVIDAGTDLDTLIKKIVMKRVPATYAAPRVTLAVSKGSPSGNYEVGTNITTTLTANFVKNDAGALTNLAILNGSTNVVEGTTSPLSATDHNFTVPEGTVTFKATAAYGEGAIKKDNLGDNSPNGHITAGSISSSGVAFTGKRNAFYGTGVGSTPELTSAFVRGLTSKTLAPSANTKLTIPVAVGQQYIVFAYPANLRDVYQVKYEETNDPGMASNFTKTIVQVKGANDFAATDYKVYTYAMAAPAAAKMTFTVTI